MSIRLYLLLCVALFAALGCGKKTETIEEQPIAELEAIPQSQTDRIQSEIAGHEYVDLGLSVLWATENVGANAPEQYGKYYAWGEIETKEEYTADNSAYYRCPQADFAGDAALDVATAMWGEPWRMPTMADFAELLDKCTFIWIHDSERTGYKVIGRNGNSIFFPAAGYVNRQSLNNVGERGYYWTSSPYGRETEYAYYFRFDDAFFYVDRDDRLHGRVVRPVTD